MLQRLPNQSPLSVLAFPSRAIPAQDSPALGATAPEQSLLPRAGEIVLTRGQKLALLVMRGSDLSKAVLAGVLEKTKAGPSGRDFYTCAMLGLAINKGRYHVLSPQGRWRADQVAREVAREYGLHIVSYDLGGPGRAASVRCTCGFSSFRSRAVPSYLTLIRQDGTRHLLHESVRRIPG